MENQLETILNHLGNTAVYVVRQDSHEILYFNDQVQRVSPKVRLGDICHELWAGSCNSCPLTDIGENETNTVIGYDDPFGKVVDISATKMEWGEAKIPAFLVSVTPHRQSPEEKAAVIERNWLSTVAAQVFPFIASINLNRNTYSILKCKEKAVHALPKQGGYDSLLSRFASILKPEEAEEFKKVFSLEKAYASFSQGKTEIYGEYRNGKPDASFHWLGVHLLQLENTLDDDVLGILLCNVVDNQKETEEQLKRERAAVYDSIPGGVVKMIMERPIRIKEASRFFYEMFGSPENFEKDGALGIYPDDRPWVLEEFYRRAAKGDPVSMEFRVNNRAGEFGWARCEGKKIGMEGQIPVYQFVVLDITNRKKVQLALEQQKLEYQLAVENSADVLFEYIPAKDLFISHEGSESGGKEFRLEHYLEQLEKYDIIHPDNIDAVRKMMSANLNRAEIRLRYPGEKEYSWVLVQGDALRKNGTILKIIGTIRNINDFRERERELQRQEKLMDTTLDTVISSAFDEVLYLNLTKDESVLRKCNQSYRSTVDMKAPEFEKNLLLTLHPKDQRLFQEKFSRKGLFQAIQQGQSRIYEEMQRMGLDGQYHWVSIEAVHLEDNGEGDTMALLLLATIDDKKQLELKAQIMALSILTMFGELIILDLETEQYVVHKADESTSSTLSISEPADFVPHNRKYGLELIHPEDQQRFFDFFTLDVMRAEVQAGKRKFMTEVRRKNGQGEYRWCEMIGTVIENGARRGHSVLLTFRDIDELRQAQQDKRAADQRFMSAVNTFYDAIYECEIPEGNIFVWKGLGGQRYQQINMPVLQERSDRFCSRLHPDYTDSFWKKMSTKSLMAAFSSGKSQVSAEAPFLWENDEYRWFTLQVQLLEMLPSGTRVMVYLKDVNDIHEEEARKQAALHDALALAEQSNSAKSDFLSRMSHDIRIPMNAIVGMSQIAHASLGDTKRVQDCLEKIDVSARFLLSLINDVLDMSKIESGKLKIAKEPFDFRALIDDVATICSEQASRRRQTFRVTAGTDVERGYIGDSLRLRQVLMNLLSNAIKYTPEGGDISLKAVVEKQQGEIAYLLLQITDNGIGMSEEFIQRIFDPFERENKGSGSQFEGTGLGLSITQNLVHLMNGEISVSSHPGEGSTFSVLLPLERVEPAALPADDTEKKQLQKTKTPFSRERVLLVEDSELNREIAQTLLEMNGLTVETAVNGKEAVECFAASKRGHFQAILMDIRMPVMDGLEATRRIRKLDRADAWTIPIIALSANAFQDEQQAARAAGINAYLTKPIEVSALCQVLLDVFKTE